MLSKNQICEKLEELKECEVVRFTMLEGSCFDIPYKNIKNYPDEEMIDAPFDNFKCFYCDIRSISPLV